MLQAGYRTITNVGKIKEDGLDFYVWFGKSIEQEVSELEEQLAKKRKLLEDCE